MPLSDILVSLSDILFLSCNKAALNARFCSHFTNVHFAMCINVPSPNSVHEMVCLFLHKTKDVKHTLSTL